MMNSVHGWRRVSAAPSAFRRSQAEGTWVPQAFQLHKSSDIVWFFPCSSNSKHHFPHREVIQALPETPRKRYLSKIANWLDPFLGKSKHPGVDGFSCSSFRKHSSTSFTALVLMLAYCHLALLLVHRTYSYFCPLLSSTLCFGEQMKCLHIHRLRRHKFSWVLL